MIFALAKEKPLLMVFLSDKDIGILKGGRTLFVDERHLPGKTFSSITLALMDSDAETIKLLDQYGRPDQVKLSGTMPYAHEEKCSGCGSITAKELMHKGKCAMCWHDAYKRLLGEM